MNLAVLAALAACFGFCMAGPYLARMLPPRAAVPLLVPSAVMAASCAVFVLGTVVFTWVGQLAEVAEYGTWSPHALHVLNPIPAGVAVAAGTLLVPAAAWFIGSAARTGWALLAVHRACRHLTSTTGAAVVVVESGDLQAFTTPGLHARIVVTTGMLAALDPPGRQVLLAHEQSHRTHRHIWWTLTADLAAAVNPLLRPTARAIRDATERWADEDAARICDRRLVAATIAHVALLSAHRPTSAVAAATGGQVPRRVAAMLHPPPRIRARDLAVLVALTLAVALGAFAVERAGEALFEHAKKPVTATAPVASTPIH